MEQLLVKYRDVFANDQSEVGRTGIIEYDIILKSGEVQPVTSGKTRPVPPKLQAEVANEIEKMLAEDVIHESTSPWNSPILCVRKPDGRIRFCIDFREVNEVTQADGGELPHMATQIDVLSGSVLFARLDERSGYWQVPLTAGAKPITGFSFNGKHYEFNVLPFGVKNGPSIFARMMNRLLRHLVDRGEPLGIYFDDITVGGKTVDHHFQLLEEVLQVLQDNCITLGVSKAGFLEKEVRILGFVVDAEGVRPDEEKVSCIRNSPMPQCARDLRCFLGKVNFIGSFIKDLQLVLAPLNQAAHLPRGKFHMSPECVKAFLETRELVADDLKNYHPDWSKPFRLTTDASDYEIGGFLSQMLGAQERVIACFSEAFTGPQLNWHTRDKELYALLKGTWKFRHYLLGEGFTWVTDHEPLLGPEQSLTAKVQRWRDELSAFDYSTVHVPGELNLTADALSRHMAVMSISELTASSSGLALHALSHHLPIASVQARARRNSAGRAPANVVLVPQAAIVETLKKYHDAQGHFCANTVLGKIRANHLYWPTMAADVARYVRSCEICQPTRHGRGDPAPDELTPTPEAPWSVISIDLCSFDEPEGTYQAILVCDMFTRYIELRVTQSKEAEVVMDALEDMWYLKRPRKVLTDKGTEFNFLEPFRAQFNFEWSRISPGNAQANGMVERANGTFIDGIRKQSLQDPGCTLKQAALRTQLHYNNRVHSSTGFTPMYLQFGLAPDELRPADFNQRPMTRVNLRSKLNQLARERSAALAKAWDDAFLLQQSQKERRQELNHAKHAEFEPFPLGHWVLARKLVTRKSQGYWIPEPYVVVQQLPGTSYQLRSTVHPPAGPHRPPSSVPTAVGAPRARSHRPRRSTPASTPTPASRSTQEDSRYRTEWRGAGATATLQAAVALAPCPHPPWGAPPHPQAG